MSNETKIKTDDEILKESVKAAIPKRYPSASPELLDKVNSMVDSELAIIKKTKFAEKILMSADLVVFAKSVGKMPYEKMEELQNKIECMDCIEIEEFVNTNSTEPGEAVAPGFGAWVSSVVCYLLGITNIDPLEYNFIFERALNTSQIIAPTSFILSPEIMEICNTYFGKKYETKSRELEFHMCPLNITAILKEIKENYGIEINIGNITTEKNVFEEIYIKGNTDDIYWFEYSTLLKEYCKEIQPRTMKELAYVCALKYHELPIIDPVKKYIISDMTSILNETHGNIIYDEQIMQLLLLAGFSIIETIDCVRCIHGRQREKYMAYLSKFVAGYEKLGAKCEDIIEFWNKIISDGYFTVSKPHAVATAVLSYQMAWLKYHYPKEFSDCFIN